MQEKIKNFTDLIVWQKAHELTLNIYKQTLNFPREELFGLISQLRRAAISVPSNIAEGFGRSSQAEKRNFYNIAAGSLTEVQSQLFLARDLKFVARDVAEELLDKTIEVHKMLNSLLAKIVNS